MQIRLTVLAAPPGGQTARRACDVLVTAPAGTALAAVASGLATAVAGPEGAAASGPVVLYAGRERLDAQRCALGEPPLIDGAVLALQAPADDTPGPEASAPEGAVARLHVIAGPDAGGVHLLHPGDIRVGRSADADVPLDDPDVSRLHCVVGVARDGRARVADLGSTNGTTLDGREVGDRPVRLAPGALLRVGESALRLTPGTVGAGGPEDTPLPTNPDGEGHLRVGPAGEPPSGDGAAAVPGGRGAAPTGGTAGGAGVGLVGPMVPGARRPYGYEGGSPDHVPAHGRAPGHGHEPAGPGTHGAPGPTPGGEHARADGAPDGGVTHSRERVPSPARPQEPALQSQTRHQAQATPARGTPVPASPEDGAPRRKGGGIGAWARRLTGARAEARRDAPDDGSGAPAPEGAVRSGWTAEAWPDPAAVLLTALGPGPRLWERAPGHPEALVVRLGTSDRAGLPAVPVTVGLREAGSLGLAGPRARLVGLARSVVAQLAALHAPADLEVVLVSADRARPLEERKRDWGWLGWLPHVRPGHGQDCRLLLAYEADQAAARVAELARRLDDGPLGPGRAGPDVPKALGFSPRGEGTPLAVAEAAARFHGPYTLVVVDGDPGTAPLRDTLARLAASGAAAGVHLLCLAETAPASALSPVAATYDAACAVSPAFRECGAVGLLSGDVATALRVMRAAGGQPAGHGTVAAVDAVSGAWAERFARALAPLRAEGPAVRGRTAAAALPRTSRLLDELELARATPASLMARWASAPDGTAVLGTGPHGPLQVDLTREGPHLLIEGPAGSGRTELLRSVAASLAAASRPDRLGLLLVDGAGGKRGEGLGPCTDLPHVTEHLMASDPVRMRAFAQALGAELKRRAELLGHEDFTDWHTRRQAPQAQPAGRPSADRSGGPGGAAAPGGRPHSGRPGVHDGHGEPGGPGSQSHHGRHNGPDALGGSGDPGTAGGPGTSGRPGGQTHSSTPGGPGGPVAPESPGVPGAPGVLGGPAASAGPGVPAAADGLGGPAPRTHAGRPTAPAAASLPEQRSAVGDLDSPPSGAIRLRPAAPAGSRGTGGVPPALPRLVVLVDDLDALVAPALGSPGRPAAGSVVRALEAVAREGAQLGVHLVAATARPDRTADSEPARRARLRIVLDAPPATPGPDDPSCGRGRLTRPDGRVTPFQGGRVTGRIPRTATLRPTVVPLEWERMGDPPARRPVRELGNGPTDLALLASALDRAARSVGASPVPPLTPDPSPR